MATARTIRGYGARSWHPAGVNLLLADCSVRLVGNQVQLATWRALSTRDGGETLSEFNRARITARRVVTDVARRIGERVE